MNATDDGGASGLTYTWNVTRPAGLEGVAYGAESSEELGSWTALPLEVIHTANEVETVRARDPLVIGDPDKRFIRLRFTRE